MRPQFFSCSIVQSPRLGNECVPNSFILLAWLMLGVVCGGHVATVETRDAFIFDTLSYCNCTRPLQLMLSYNLKRDKVW